MTTHTRNHARIRGASLVEMMIVATIFVLIATSIYRTLSNLTQLQATTDSAVQLQIEGQKAMNVIADELRFAGFFRPLPDNTLLKYDASLWTLDPQDDNHPNFDVPYLWADEGDARGVFAGLSHAPAQHAANVNDEEFQATREICFLPLGSYVTSPTVPPIANVQWTTGTLGADSSVVLPVQWQLVSYELESDGNGVNHLRRRVRNVTPATMAIGNVISDTSLARFVEAVRFDTAQTDPSLALYTVKVTIWLRKTSPSGQALKAKVQSRVKLRNSVH